MIPLSIWQKNNRILTLPRKSKDSYVKSLSEENEQTNKKGLKRWRGISELIKRN